MNIRIPQPHALRTVLFYKHSVIYIYIYGRIPSVCIFVVTSSVDRESPSLDTLTYSLSIPSLQAPPLYAPNARLEHTQTQAAQIHAPGEGSVFVLISRLLLTIYIPDVPLEPTLRRSEQLLRAPARLAIPSRRRRTLRRPAVQPAGVSRVILV